MYERPRAEISAGTGGDICGHGRRYLRARAEISADKGGDITPQSRGSIIPTSQQRSLNKEKRFFNTTLEDVEKMVWGGKAVMA